MKQKENYQSSHQSGKKPLGKRKEIDTTKLFKIITTSKAASPDLRLGKEVAIVKGRKEST